MATFPDVRTLTSEPVVGRYYRVPCVRVPERERLPWIPVFGPLHDDAEWLNFTAKHFHVDPRFMGDRLLRRYVGIRWSGRSWAAQSLGRPVSVTDWKTGEPLPGAIYVPTMRRLRCLRRMPMFPCPLRRLDGPVADRKARPFDVEYRGAHPDARLINGRCPHRGIDLRSMPEDPDGMVTCPGHGLRWCPVSDGLADRQLSDMGDESNQGRGSGRRKG